MGAAVLTSLAGPLIGSVVQNILGSSSGSTGTSGSGGLFGGLLNEFTSAFSGLFGGSSHTASPYSNLTPYSTANMAPMSLNNPMAQLQPAMGRMQEFSTVIVRDHRHFGGGYQASGSANDSAGIAQVGQYQTASDQAQQASMADPTNAQKTLAAQQAAQSYQTAFAEMTSKLSINASLSKEATQNWKI